MKLSVIVPVYNERKTIARVLEQIREVPLEKEIIVVDGDSTDGTKQILREEEKKGDVKLLHEFRRRGKGSAVREGLKQAEGDVVVIQDADLEVRPAEYPRLLVPIQRNEAEVVFGSRFLNGHNRFPVSTLIANRTLTFFTNLFFRGRLTDVLTCHKMFRRDALRGLPLECRRFDLDQELAVKFLKGGRRIREIPITYTPRPRRAGKKIFWRDGFSCLWTILKYRFVNGSDHE